MALRFLLFRVSSMPKLMDSPILDPSRLGFIFLPTIVHFTLCTEIMLGSPLTKKYFNNGDPNVIRTTNHKTSRVTTNKDFSSVVTPPWYNFIHSHHRCLWWSHEIPTNNHPAKVCRTEMEAINHPSHLGESSFWSHLFWFAAFDYQSLPKLAGK